MDKKGWFGGDHVWIDEWNKLAEEAVKIYKPNCICGSTITMGKDDHPTFHDRDCEIRKKYERDNK